MKPLVPQYGAAALANVVPSILAGLGVPDMTAALGLPGARRVCLLLVDGLGWKSLRSREAEAPFLSSLASEREPITAGFPATTATSIAALGTGLPPGENGFVGYSFAAADNVMLNALGWHLHADGRPVDLRSRIVPEEFQPHRTAFERAAQAGVAVSIVAPRDQNGSGLSRAVLRGGRFVSAHTLGDLTSRTLEALRAHDRAFCYAYHGDLDVLGHVYGPSSDPWRHQLAYVDQLAARIADGLPHGAMLVITADHGMVEIGADDRVDLDDEPLLQDGVRMLGGEARARHVYTESGATDDVFDAWQSLLGDRAWILRRDDAITAGWFGPQVDDRVRPRIGDLVAAAQGTLAMTRSRTEARLSRFIGQHGSLTPHEQLVPLLVFQKA
ncbi:alkaline phosphatase family protein [Pseudonocardia yunnanensis]|uniref:Alkaline phosphatase family protein n=1 Tax=Pseudonocardia yunnanensis TaxID=58107 RepID=A0ABW4FDX9_9PSEU